MPQAATRTALECAAALRVAHVSHAGVHLENQLEECRQRIQELTDVNPSLKSRLTDALISKEWMTALQITRAEPKLEQPDNDISGKWPI